MGIFRLRDDCWLSESTQLTMFCKQPLLRNSHSFSLAGVSAKVRPLRRISGSSTREMPEP